MSQERFTYQNKDTLGAPSENFARGLLGVELPGFGQKIEGKVRDNWVVKKFDERIMITTDRQSAYDSMVCTVPGKGKVLNLLSAFWFENTRNIIPNHMIAVPHPNVLIARQAKETLPIELIVRGYMARSSTSTSVYHNYAGLGRREIYGIKFPDGLLPNQEFPMGHIITPTTKATSGHDVELTSEKARQIVDSKFGNGTYSKAEKAALELFEKGARHHGRRGLILADTKYEFGIDNDRNLMLIDEIHTPDSSRLWLEDTYQERFQTGDNPDTFDKDILRRWLAENSFKGEEGKRVPVVDTEVINQMALAYEIPYEMITGNRLPETPNDPLKLEREIQQAVNRFYNR